MCLPINLHISSVSLGTLFVFKPRVTTNPYFGIQLSIFGFAIHFFVYLCLCLFNSTVKLYLSLWPFNSLCFRITCSIFGLRSAKYWIPTNMSSHCSAKQYQLLLSAADSASGFHSFRRQQEPSSIAAATFTGILWLLTHLVPNAESTVQPTHYSSIPCEMYGRLRMFRNNNNLKFTFTE